MRQKNRASFSYVLLFVVTLDQFFNVIDPVGKAPAAAANILKDGRAADVVDDRLPIHRIGKVAEAVGHGVGGDVLVGQDGRAWGANPQFVHERPGKKLGVVGPDEGIIDDSAAHDRGVLDVGVIVGDFVRHAIDDDVVVDRIVQERSPHLDQLGPASRRPR